MQILLKFKLHSLKMKYQLRVLQGMCLAIHMKCWAFFSYLEQRIREFSPSLSSAPSI